MTVLGIDIGTSGCKGLLLGDEGESLATSLATYQPRTVGGRVELEVCVVRDAAFAVIRTLARESRRQGLLTRAISFSISGDEMVPVDAHSTPLMPMVLSSDPRGEATLGKLQALLPPSRLAEITGLPLACNFPLVRWLWTLDTVPEVARATRKLLCWDGLAGVWLGAQPAIDYSNAGRTLLFDVHSRQWSTEILTAVGMRSSLLPVVVPSGTVTGHVSAKAAQSTGLTPGTLVVSGGFDQAMASFGAGLRDEGQAVLSLGTWEALTIIASPDTAKRPVQSSGIAVGNHVERDRWYALLTNPNGGAMRMWFDGLIGSGSGLQVTPSAGPSELEIVPDLYGAYTPWMTRRSRASIEGITAETTPADILGAFLEAVAYDHREALNRLHPLGLQANEIRVVGGGARSSRILHLKADSLGTPLVPVEIAEPGALAAAALAGVACGLYDDAHKVVDLHVRVGSIVEPRAAYAQRFDEAFWRYRTRRIERSDNPLAPNTEKGPLA